MPKPRFVTLATLIAIVTAALISIATCARAQVGQRNFFDPMITQDADPSNELTLEPGWSKSSSGSQTAFSFSLEKQLTANFSLFVGDALGDFSRRRVQGSTGLDNVEFIAKWAFFKSDEHETRLALALDMYAPTGSIQAGSGGHWRGGPMFLIARGAGDLPNRGFFHYLRPFAFQADGEYLPRWTGSQLDVTAADFCFSYQLDYLAASGTPIPWPNVLRPFVPYVEFNYAQVPWGANFSTTPPDWRVTPGIAYQTNYYEVAVATQLALNNPASSSDQAAALFAIDIYYDQIFPRLGASF